MAFFSGFESGITSLNRARLVHWAREGVASAKRLLRCSDDMQQTLATVLVGTNLASVAVSTFSATLSERLLLGTRHAKLWETVWAGGMALTILYVSEYLPKLFFSSRPLRRTLPATRVFVPLQVLLAPLAKIVFWATDFLVPKPKDEEERRFLVTRQYIDDVVQDEKDGAKITSVERTLIRRVLHLQDQTAASIMTPRDRMTMVLENDTLAECFERVRQTGHVRLPVFDTSGTRCVGVFSILNAYSKTTSLDDPLPLSAPVREFMRPPVFVDADIAADDLLPLMRERRRHMLIVRNAGGQGNNGAEEVLGLLTTENVLNVMTSALQTK